MIATRTQPIHLLEAEFVACWQILRLGDLPLALALRPLGATHTERRRLHSETLATLAHRGLAGPHGLSASLAELLQQIANPTYQVDIRIAGGPPGMIVGLGTITGQHGVLVIAVPNSPLQILPLSTTYLPQALLDLAGPLTPGQGRPVNIPADLLDHACRSASDNNLWTLADQLVSLGVPRLDASSLVHMCTNIQKIGQIGATAWINGTPRRAPWVIGFHQTSKGHFLQLRRPYNATDTHAVTISPINTDGLLRHLRELLRNLLAAA